MKKRIFSTTSAKTSSHSQGKKKEINLSSPHTIQKMLNSKWIKDLHIKVNITALLEKKSSRKSDELGVGRDYLDRNS